MSTYYQTVKIPESSWYEVGQGNLLTLCILPAGHTILRMKDPQWKDGNVILQFEIDDPMLPEPTITLSLGYADEPIPEGCQVLTVGGPSSDWQPTPWIDVNFPKRDAK